MPLDELLFHKADWSSVANSVSERLRSEIETIDGNRLLNTSVTDMCEYLVAKYRVNVPELDHASIVVDQHETKVDMTNNPQYGPSYDGRRIMVDGIAIDVTVPYTGDEALFNVRPSSFDFNPPRATVRSGHIIIHVVDLHRQSEEFAGQIKQTLEHIDEYLANLRANADPFNAGLPTAVQNQVEARRQRLLNNQNIVAGLGFNLKPRPETTKTYVAPEIRRKVAVAPPQAKSSPYQPEPCLSDQDYEYILGVIRGMSDSIERSPGTFANMGEEALRTLFLVALNGHYEGQATGETFNSAGKTDILIRVNGRNVFIAECKFWGGPKKLLETFDQILSYSSWRDTKVAVIVFNRNKDFTKVLDGIVRTVPAHPLCKRQIKRLDETSF